MGVEIERKFLVVNDNWRKEAKRSTNIAQGYLNDDPRRTVRVRIRDRLAWLTVKGVAEGLVRPEFEYEIPVEDARQLMALTRTSLSKIRHEIDFAGKTWEVDEFQGAHAGLVIAELELDTEAESFERPAWLGREVSEDPAYFNSTLARAAYATH